MKNPRGNVGVIVLIIVLAAAIFGAGGYWVGTKYGKKSATPKTTSETTSTEPETSAKPDESASLKTYTNEKLGFSLKYPATWTEKENTDQTTGGAIAVQLTSPETAKIVAETPAPEQSEGPINSDVDIYYYDSITDETLQGTPAKHQTLDELAADTALYMKPEKITFAGYPAYEVISLGMVDAYTVLVERNGHVYVVQAIKTENKAKLSAEVKAIFDSFQFTK